MIEAESTVQTFSEIRFWVLVTKLSRTMKIFLTEFKNSIQFWKASMIFVFSKYQSTTTWHNPSRRSFILCVQGFALEMLIIFIISYIVTHIIKFQIFRRFEKLRLFILMFYKLKINIYSKQNLHAHNWTYKSRLIPTISRCRVYVYFIHLVMNSK